jgi:hypothetical protein
MIKLYIDLRVKYPLFLSDCNETWIFSTVFRKNPQIWNFTKTLPLGVELFHALRQTDRHNEANSRFSQFCEAAYKDCSVVITIHNKFAVHSTRCAVKGKGRHPCSLIRLHRPLAIVWGVEVKGYWQCGSLEGGYSNAIATDLSENINLHVMWNLRIALLWIITQREVVIPNRRFGTTYWSHSQGFSDSWIPRMRPIGCPKRL